MKKRAAVCCIIGIILVMALAFGGACVVLRVYLSGRGHGNVVVRECDFQESDRVLHNPNRGFYHMHGFVIEDAVTDYRENLANRYCRDTETALTLVEINLRNYRDGDISQEGLDNIERLLDTLDGLDKKLILRFLYDWNGQNETVEPESLDIILRHIEQVGPLLKKHRDRIFTLQGLFIGNWGEMNGTKYLATEDLQALARQLAAVTDDGTFLSVRMPAQWRKITQLASADGVERGDGSLASRLGLYNDGMLGSWSDCGTYGDQSFAANGAFTYWNREEELAFQEELCRRVPIGGEVINDNEYNDLENAIRDMKTMHVTYVNRDYDTKVLDKWAASVYHGEDCFDGMDGLSYIERHLGYRLLIDGVRLRYGFQDDALSVDVDLKNAGFAPVYEDAEIRVTLYNETDNKLYSYEMEGDLRELAGGNDAQETLTLHRVFSLSGEQPGEWAVFFEIRDRDTGSRIQLANRQDPEEYGYRIGEIELETLEELWEQRQNWRNLWNGEEDGRN